METLADQGLVTDNHLVFTHTVHDGALVEVSLQGIIECAEDVFIKVDKALGVRKIRNGQVQVRGKDYAYHAWLNLTPTRDLIRYCSAHGLDDFHCHLFDPATGEELGRPSIDLADLPTLGDFIPLAIELGRAGKVAKN